MATRVLLTIDTELLWRPGEGAWTWERLFARSYDPAGVGVPWQLRVLADYRLKATFFIDPMPACEFGLEPVKRMIAPILEAGQDVQLHLHPNWHGAAGGRTNCSFELNDWDEDGQQDLIALARDHLVAAGAPEPMAFRAGSYAADDATLRALARLGIAYDSSHDGNHAPWPSSIGLPRTQIAPVRHEGVIEVPVSQIAEGGALRHLQLCALSAAEMRAALDHAAAHDHPVATIVSHSFELASRSGARANGVHVRRFEALCEHLAARRDALTTAWFADLDGLALDVEAVPMRADRLRASWRRAEQLWSHLAHERGG